MATSSNEQKIDIKDFSQATQRKSSKFLPKDNQQELGVNASYRRIGALEKIPGYTQFNNTITSSSTSTTTSTTTTTTSTSTSSSTSTSTSTSSTTTA